MTRRTAKPAPAPAIDTAVAAYRAEVEARAIRVAQKERKTAKPTAPRAVLAAGDKRKNGLLSARGLPCLCGCAKPTHTLDARFLSGHDAILRKNVLYNGQALPEIIRPFYEAGEIIAGMKLIELEDGTLELIDTKNGAVEDAIARKR